MVLKVIYFQPARQYDFRIQIAPDRVADGNLATRLVFQKRQKRHVSNNDDTQSLYLAMEG